MSRANAPTEMIHARIDGKLKRSTQRIFSKMGISTTDAIRIFLKQVELHKGLPFPITIPNAETIAAIEESKDTAKLKRYSSFSEILKEV